MARQSASDTHESSEDAIAASQPTQLTRVPAAKTRRGAQTRRRLVEAAATVFSEYGYSAARIADMVRMAGISHGNFYRHFPGKDEVLLAVLEEPLAELRRASGREPDPVHRSGLDLDELIRANTNYFAAYARQRHLFRVMREAAAVNPEFARLWLSVRQGFVGRTAHWLAALVEAGQLEAGLDVELLAETLGSMMEHLAYVQIGLPAELPRPETIDALGRVTGESWYLILTGRSRLGETDRGR
jgi:AcrR family transcriptional regulator